MQENATLKEGCDTRLRDCVKERRNENREGKSERTDESRFSQRDRGKSSVTKLERNKGGGVNPTP